MHTNSVKTQYAIGVSFFDAFNLGRFKTLSQGNNRRLCCVLNNRQHLFSGAKSSNSLQLGKQLNHSQLLNFSNWDLRTSVCSWPIHRASKGILKRYTHRRRGILPRICDETSNHITSSFNCVSPTYNKSSNKHRRVERGEFGFISNDKNANQ